MPKDFNHQDAVFWGKFILSAEKMYDKGKRSPVASVPLPGDFVRTRNISMQARVEFLHEEEFIGFIAEAPSQPGQQVAVFHGSQTLFDWIDDFEFALEKFPYLDAKVNGESIKTEYGFTQLYESFSFTDLKTGSVQTLAQYLGSIEKVSSYTVVGHSLGGALAALHAAAVAYRGVHVTAYTFAAPMAGDKAFAEYYHSLIYDSYAIVNEPDIVPQLPGHVLGYEPPGQIVTINSLEVPEIKRCLRCYHRLGTYLYTLGCKSCDLGSCRAKNVKAE